MKNKLGGFLITALGLLLLIYSAARSLDFISMTLPADKAILAYFGLAALDGGLVFWLLSFLYGARGWQRVIAILMVVVDFLGAVLMFTLDTMLNTGKAGLTSQLSQNDIQTAVLALSIIIAANVGATVMHHIMDPANLRQMAEEEARDKIESLAVKEIMANAGQLAAEIVPQIGRAWKEQELANYQTVIKGRKKPAELPAQAMTILAQEVTRSISVPEKSAALPELSVSLPESDGVLKETANPTKPAKSRKPKVT